MLDHAYSAKKFNIQQKGAARESNMSPLDSSMVHIGSKGNFYSHTTKNIPWYVVIFHEEPSQQKTEISKTKMIRYEKEIAVQ